MRTLVERIDHGLTIFGCCAILGFVISFAPEALAAQQIKYSRAACWAERLTLNHYEWICPYPSDPGPETNAVDAVDVHAIPAGSSYYARVCVRYAVSTGGDCGTQVNLSSGVTTFDTSGELEAWADHGADFAYVYVKNGELGEFKGFVVKQD